MTETSLPKIEITEDLLDKIKADERKAGRNEGFSDRRTLEHLRDQFFDALHNLDSRLVSATDNRQAAVEFASEYRDAYIKFNELAEKYRQGNRDAVEDIVRSVESARAILNTRLERYNVMI